MQGGQQQILTQQSVQLELIQEPDFGVIRDFLESIRKGNVTNFDVNEGDLKQLYNFMDCILDYSIAQKEKNGMLERELDCSRRNLDAISENFLHLKRDFDLKEALNAELNTISYEQNSQALKFQASLADALEQSQRQERDADKLHQEIENLEEKLKAQKGQEASKITALTQENNDLNATITSIIGQLKRYEEHLRENDYQLQHLKAERQSLYLQIESLNASFDHSLRQVQSLMKEKLLLEGVLQTLQSKRSPSPKGERNTRQLQMTPSSNSAGIKRSGLHIRSMLDLESNVSHEPEAAQNNLMLNNMEIDALSIGDQCDGYHSYRSSCSRAFEWIGPTDVQQKCAALNRKSISPPDTARLSHYTPKQQQITEASESIETSNMTTSQVLNTDRSSLLLREKDEECFSTKSNSMLEMLFDNLQPQMLLKKQYIFSSSIYQRGQNSRFKALAQVKEFDIHYKPRQTQSII